MKATRGLPLVGSVGLLLALLYGPRPTPTRGDIRPSTPSTRQSSPTLEPANKDVVSLTGTASDLESYEVRRAAIDVIPKDVEAFSKLADIPLTPTVLGISSSGPGTGGGTRRAPLHFASVVEKHSGKSMKFYVLLASSLGFINRSRIAWGGDYIPGLRITGRMYDRQTTKGPSDRMTAELHLTVPGQDKIDFLFVGYDSEGKQIPAFGRKPFAEHVAGLKPRGGAPGKSVP